MANQTVRAKFRCTSVMKRIWSTTEFVYDYKFDAVVGDSPENKAFFKATPSGQITLSSVVSQLFEVGDCYYLDFIEVDIPNSTI